MLGIGLSIIECCVWLLGGGGGAAPSGNYVLREDGSLVLREDGSPVVRETF